ncbi:MAG: DNA alkylation repair protein [Anaerorhabdus sp.]|nr:DNA alkylation repair protein [Anaerorhabdus sp.]MEA4875761.1 DNA alkylation repair protein [Anaerorhabdus sp.]
MKITEVIHDLQSNANPSRRKVMLRNGGAEDCLGVNLGYLRQYALKLKNNEDLLYALWSTDITDANLLAAMAYSDQPCTLDEFQELIEQSTYIEINDELCFKSSLNPKDKNMLIQLWIDSEYPLLRRSAWDLIITLILDKNATPKQINTWLKRIKKDMLKETGRAQETMNRALSEIGIHYDEYTEECIKLGEDIGLYKDYKPSKGCTSPYAPIWINVLRKKLNK